jgi:hypothetical protein
VSGPGIFVSGLLTIVHPLAARTHYMVIFHLALLSIQLKASLLQVFVAVRVTMGVALGGNWPAMHALTGAEPSGG